MPRVELQAPNGEYRIIMTSNPQTLAAWLYEQVHDLGPKFGHYQSFTIRFQPCYVSRIDGPDEPDWCVDQSHWGHHEIQSNFGDQLEELIGALEKMRSQK